MARITVICPNSRRFRVTLDLRSSETTILSDLLLEFKPAPGFYSLVVIGAARLRAGGTLVITPWMPKLTLLKVSWDGKEAKEAV